MARPLAGQKVVNYMKEKSVESIEQFNKLWRVVHVRSIEMYGAVHACTCIDGRDGLCRASNFSAGPR